MEARAAETPRETLERLRLEIAELRASRERLVRAADADRRRIERALHDGVHQDLIGLAVDVQLVARSIDADHAAAKVLLEQMGRDLQRALDDIVRLAQRVYPPQLDGGGLRAALRAVATSTDAHASIEIGGDASPPPEVVSSVCLRCLDALETAGAGATVTVRDEDRGLSLAVESAEPWAENELERLRDRVEALGGRLTVEPTTTGARLTASLPLPR